ncbi:MAG: hypothetical protein RBG13Loki_1167 [Promethearchaeota archaeon CR_4]|nr:MAG: hypothetical protein RBG13Loki_1167 [Candidatus Lokiarchaeota archaeon CR_4]
MNVWIVYDSRYGNNKKIAEVLAGHFKDGNNVHVHYAKEISQQALIDGGIDILMFGGPLRFGTPSSTIKRWANKMTGLLNQKAVKVGKTAIWGTHMKDAPDTPPGKCAWDVAKPKWKAILDTFPAEKKAPEIQGFVVGAIAGRDTLEAGWQDLVARFADTVKSL